MTDPCPRFIQNAWRKDLCSNCFKSKKEHQQIIKKQIKMPSVPKESPKSIMKSVKKDSKKRSVSFHSELSEVIGFGGDDSDENNEEIDEPDYSPIPEDFNDEFDADLVEITKMNTDFNMNTENLLSSPKVNSKKTYVSLKLGVSQQKKPLQISVVPFGSDKQEQTTHVYSAVDKSKNNKNNEKQNESKQSPKSLNKKIEFSTSEKSLLEEISESLEKGNILKSENEINLNIGPVVTTINPALHEPKRSLQRHNPIKKDQAKPKIFVFPKNSNISESSDGSNSSDTENNLSPYYDVVCETNNYENTEIEKNKKSSPPTKKSFFSSQIISDMFSSKKSVTESLRKRSETYNLFDRSYIISKITSDGLIVTNNSNGNSVGSSDSSFDSSSDEELTAVAGGNNVPVKDYQNIDKDNLNNDLNCNKKMVEKSFSNDYEDINVDDKSNKSDEDNMSVGKSRELAGEPDGRSDPDGSAESPAPALPTSPPPIMDAKKSFLHSLQQKSMEKPQVPTKPTANVLKTFAKRPQSIQQQQVITQLQQVIKQTQNESSKNEENLNVKPKLDKKDENELYKAVKKGRAPNPPPSPTLDDSGNSGNENDSNISSNDSNTPSEKSLDTKDDSPTTTLTSIYTRKQNLSISSNSPVVREKDKRERNVVNPKFRSLNNFSSNRSSYAEKPNQTKSNSRKALSLSQDALNNCQENEEKKTKSKFSIKKFLRMGSNTKMFENSFGNKKDTGNKEDQENSSNDENCSTNMPTPKPRLVIIHPLDINNGGVEVIKDLKSSETNSSVVHLNNSAPTTPTTPTSMGSKPPAPPQRTNFNSNKTNEIIKPARPPPPKSTEIKIKQLTTETINTNIVTNESENKKNDRIYANLGEVRSIIAPRKPERTSSIRSDKDSNYKLQRRRPIGQYENATSSSYASSDTSSQIDTFSKESDISSESDLNHMISRTPSDASDLSFKKDINHHQITNENTLEHSTEQKSDVNETKDEINNDKIDGDGVNDNRNLCNRNSLMTASAPSTLLKTYSNSVCNFGVSNMEVDSRSTLSFDVGARNSKKPYSFSDMGSIYGDKSDFDIYSQKLSKLPSEMSISFCEGKVQDDTESYSTYSYYGSEAGSDMSGLQDGTWMKHSNAKHGMHRLRIRKGRSIVHKNLEDNYGAVVVANHEALVQVLDQDSLDNPCTHAYRQMQQAKNIPIHLRPIVNSTNLRFEDFILNEGARGVVVGRRAFHSAVWSNHIQVTLALSAHCNQISGVGGELNQLSGGISGALNPIAEFCDLVPSNYLPVMPSTQVRMIQTTISVLPRMNIDTIQSFGNILKTKITNYSTQKQKYSSNTNLVQKLNTEDGENITNIINGNSTNLDEIVFHEVGFIMLQLVNGLKNLQAKGIEEMPLSLSNVVLCKEIENKESQARLCVLQSVNQDMIGREEEAMGTLCQCAHAALTTMLPSTKYTNIVSTILKQEKSDSLSKAKSILEYAIWGPSDVDLTGSVRERELALQRWLDLERATILHGLVRNRTELTVYDECHLMFLVRSNAKIMNEASNLLTSTD